MRAQANSVWIDSVLWDIRYAVRSLSKTPGFTITTIASLTLGLGAALAIFTVADNLLVRPLPYRDASRLVMLWEFKGGDPNRAPANYNVVSPGNYFDWKAANDVLQGMAGLSPVRSAVLTDNGRAEEFRAQSVTADFFPLLGVQPVRGRVFRQEEDRPGNATNPTLISYRLWQSWFSGDENIIGRKIEVNSLAATIVGVLPSNFHFVDREVDLWGTLGLNPAQDRSQTGRWMWCVGRLGSGVDIKQAQAHMRALAQRLEREYPAYNTNWTVRVEALRNAMYRETTTPLLVLLAAVAMLLAVACANVANLLLARYSSRTRELAVRASLGAGRWRIIRQLLTESVVLGAAGGIGGMILARWTISGLVASAPSDLGRAAEIHIDLRIGVAAVALSLLTSIIFGLAPALVTSRVELVAGLRGDSRSGLGVGRLLRSWLVGAEVAISVILVAGALLLLRSLAGLEAVNPGLDVSNVLAFRVTLSPVRYREDRQRTQFLEKAIGEMRRLPGVRSVSATNCLPFTGPCAGTYVRIEGRPAARPGTELEALILTVMPGYFGTLGIPLKSGRDFTESDNSGARAYHFIVNEAFVRQFLRDEQPLGKRISAEMADENPFGEIIGVVGDARAFAIDHESMPTVYYPYSQLAYPRMEFLVRAERSPEALTEAARGVIRRLDPAEPIADVRTMEDVLDENFSRQRFSAWLLSGFAAVALLLASVGIYGVLSYSVGARTREFGVRAALGADAGRIVALVVRTGVLPVAGGLVIGVAGALALSGLLRSLLFGIAPRDPVTFTAVPVLFASVAVMAGIVPARRAARLDPMQALRTE